MIHNSKIKNHHSQEGKYCILIEPTALFIVIGVAMNAGLQYIQVSTVWQQLAHISGSFTLPGQIDED
jgi:flagellar motor component MotA